MLGYTSQSVVVTGQYRPRLDSDMLPVVGLQGPGNQAADDAVRGDNMQLVRLLDVDGEVGDGLATDLQLLLALFSSHVRSELGLTLVPPHQAHVWAGRSAGTLLISFL